MFVLQILVTKKLPLVTKNSNIKKLQPLLKIKRHTGKKNQNIEMIALFIMKESQSSIMYLFHSRWLHLFQIKQSAGLIPLLQILFQCTTAGVHQVMLTETILSGKKQKLFCKHISILLAYQFYRLCLDCSTNLHQLRRHQQTFFTFPSEPFPFFVVSRQLQK